jgi:hypothetical protein
MEPNWGGDIIFRDTLIPNKRFVIGTPQQPIPTDIREWVQPTNSVGIFNTLKQIPGMPQTKRMGDFDRRAHAVWAYVAQRIRYNYDKDVRGYEDFWLFADETIALGIGDCEDTSILLAVLLICAGISPYCVRIALGTFYKQGTLAGAHAWVVYHDEWGIWRLLESTLDAVPHYLPEAARFTAPNAPLRYAPDFCFNGEHLWWIRSPAQPQAPAPPGIDAYFRGRAQAGVVNVGMTPALRNQVYHQAIGR